MKKYKLIKQNKIREIGFLTEKSISTILIDFSKLKSNDLKNIRKISKEKNIELKVIKNNLAKKNFENNKNNKLINYLKGQTMLITSTNEVIDPIKFVSEQIKKYEEIKIKVIYIYEKIYEKEKINELNKIPTRKKSIISVNNSIKMPIIKINRHFKMIYLKIILILNLISKKK